MGKDIRQNAVDYKQGGRRFSISITFSLSSDCQYHFLELFVERVDLALQTSEKHLM